MEIGGALNAQMQEVLANQNPAENFVEEEDPIDIVKSDKASTVALPIRAGITVDVIVHDNPPDLPPMDDRREQTAQWLEVGYPIF